MGQQQLLLLVLGIIVVGVAIVAGIAAADVSLQQHDADALVNRCLTIAQDAVFWKTKSNPFYGGNASYTGLQTGGFDELFLGEETEGGVFKITKAEDNDLTIKASSKRYPNVGVCVEVVGEEIVNTKIDYAGGIDINSTDDC